MLDGVGDLARTGKSTRERQRGGIRLIGFAERRADLTPTLRVAREEPQDACEALLGRRVAAFELRHTQEESGLRSIGRRIDRQTEPISRPLEISERARRSTGYPHRRRMPGAQTKTGTGPPLGLGIAGAAQRDDRGQLVDCKIVGSRPEKLRAHSLSIVDAALAQLL